MKLADWLGMSRRMKVAKLFNIPRKQALENLFLFETPISFSRLKCVVCRKDLEEFNSICCSAECEWKLFQIIEQMKRICYVEEFIELINQLPELIENDAEEPKERYGIDDDTFIDYFDKSFS